MKKIDTKQETQESSFWASLILPMDLMMVVGCANNALMLPDLAKTDESGCSAEDSVDKAGTLSDVVEAA